ncbi:LysM peptidoglycan-binding domain-containing protein [Demequina globuliformis]|uniref:LysM peptidoglycan-binding domain-containing protein n=1 Tax=Demequina globuliformis TaxID=676202 RepID=UPI000AC1A62F|nr:LysM peptidoglycan-binding domain-containing protein [Demequina globuliformis]
MTAVAMTSPKQAVRPRPVGAAPRPRVRVIDTPVMRRRRRTVVAVLLAIVAAIVGPQAFADSEGGTPTAFDTYTVAHGETLWSIASAYTPEGEDVRDAVSEISSLNALGGSSLQVGQQLRVPVSE